MSKQKFIRFWLLLILVFALRAFGFAAGQKAAGQATPAKAEHAAKPTPAASGPGGVFNLIPRGKEPVQKSATPAQKGELVEGHWVTTKNGKKIWIKPHYRKKKTTGDKAPGPVKMQPGKSRNVQAKDLDLTQQKQKRQRPVRQSQKSDPKTAKPITPGMEMIPLDTKDLNAKIQKGEIKQRTAKRGKQGKQKRTKAQKNLSKDNSSVFNLLPSGTKSKEVKSAKGKGKGKLKGKRTGNGKKGKGLQAKPKNQKVRHKTATPQTKDK